MRKISTKLFLISLASIILTTTVVLIPTLVGMTQIINELAMGDMQSSMNTIEASVDRMRRSTLGVSTLVAQNPDITSAIQAGDNHQLTNALTALFVDPLIFPDPSFVTITDSQGIVLARAHSGQTGDNIADRRGVSRAINGLYTSDIEPDGESSLGIVSTVPIIADGTMIGTVSTGYDMGQPAFVDYLQHITNSEITVFAYDVSIMTTIVSAETGDRSYGFRIAPHIADVVLGERDIFYMETEIAPRPGELFLAYYRPFLDETGEVLGLIFTGQNLTDVRNIERQVFLVSIGFSALVIALVFLASRFVNNKIIVLPLKRAIQIVSKLSEGNMQILDIPPSSKDELGQLFSGTRKMAESILRQQHIYDANPISASLWADDLNILDCNDAAAELVGASNKQEYIDKLFDFHPENQSCGTPSAAKALELFAQALEEGHVRCTWTQRHADGELIPCDLTLVRIDQQGSRIIAAYLQDLRPMREAANNLREAEERIKLMLDATPLAISLYDKSSSTIDCNQEALKMFGLPHRLEYVAIAITTMPLYQPGGRKSKELLEEMIAQAFEEGYAQAKFISMKTDGTLFPTEASWVRVKYKDNFVVVEYLRDLTEEEAVKQREREANELAQLFLDCAPLCIEMWNDKRELIYCNQQMLDISGLDTFEQYKDRFEEFSASYQPDGTASSEKLHDMLDKAMREGFARFEWTHKTANGEPVPYESQFIRVTRHGRYEVLGYSHDVREIKDAMAKIHEADKWAALMMDATPLSCFMVRRVTPENGKMNFEVIDCNRAAVDLFGFSDKADAISRFHDFLPKSLDDTDYADIVDGYVSEAMENGLKRFESAQRHMSGELIPCEVTLIRVNYKGEQVLACFQNDLRPIKASMEKEREAYELTQTFLDSAPFFVEVWDSNLNLLECNDTTARMFGLAGREEYVKLFNRLSPEYQPCGALSSIKIRELLKSCFRDGSSHAEWMHITLDGDPLPVDVTYMRLKRGNEDIAVGYSQDLRPIKDAMAKEREAEEESQAKTRFLARMSHEIRTPMNAVMGITEIELQKNIHPQETEEAFKRIYNSSRLLLAIINDILDLSKVEAGKMEIVPAVYEMASLIADTVQLNLIYIGSKRIEFTLEVDEKLPSHLIGDELRIKQILNNLLSNAFKYTPEGKVTLAFGLDDVSGTDDITLVISVTDTGQGINKEQLAGLFEIEYTRFNLDQNRAIEGSGLGMSITRSLVEMMDGRIKVESEPDKGSVFTVYIPQKIEGDQVLGTETAENLKNLQSAKIYLRNMSVKAHEPMPYGRVLVVDDVESNLYVVRGFLLPYKLAVETVNSGPQAIALIEEGQVYDIIFMDHMMPDMDGIQAVKILRDIGYRHPIVALTANATFGASQMFMSNGFSGFISKPIDPNKLDACLMELIHDKQPEEVTAAAKARYLSRPEDNTKDLSDILIKLFMTDAEKSLAALEPIMQSDMDSTALKIYTTQAHGMKSALANIGRLELSRTAAALEEAGRNGDLKIIKSRTPYFLESLREIIETYQARVNDDSLDFAADSAFIGEQLLAISQACEAYDKKGAKNTLSMLKQHPLSKQTKAALDKIETGLLLGEFEESAALAKQAAEAVSKGKE
ncbi:MAG: PAS domain-containing protein [Defluviitaleaceae bacterium]|nr:PAS domain-containing protein [Defluviitaleaceae bacterium]